MHWLLGRSLCPTVILVMTYFELMLKRTFMKSMLWQSLCLTVTNDCSLIYYIKLLYVCDEIWRPPFLCLIVNNNDCLLLLRVTKASSMLRLSMLAKTLYEYGRWRWNAGQGTLASPSPGNRFQRTLQNEPFPLHSYFHQLTSGIMSGVWW